MEVGKRCSGSGLTPCCQRFHSSGQEGAVGELLSWLVPIVTLALVAFAVVVVSGFRDKREVASTRVPSGIEYPKAVRIQRMVVDGRVIEPSVPNPTSDPKRVDVVHVAHHPQTARRGRGNSGNSGPRAVLRRFILCLIALCVWAVGGFCGAWLIVNRDGHLRLLGYAFAAYGILVLWGALGLLLLSLSPSTWGWWL